MRVWPCVRVLRLFSAVIELPAPVDERPGSGFIALAGAFGPSSIDTTWAWTKKRNTPGDKPGVPRAGWF